jgi:hypothetical protein
MGIAADSTNPLCSANNRDYPGGFAVPQADIPAPPRLFHLNQLY